MRTVLLLTIGIAACGDTDHDAKAAGITDEMFDPGRSAAGIRELERMTDRSATVIDVRYPSATTDEVPAYLVVPQAQGPFPLVLFGHWMMEGSPLRNRREFLDEAIVLARSGAMSFLVDAPQVRPGYPTASDEMNALELESHASRQQVKDLRRALDLLVGRDDVDSTRIAYVGHSFHAHVGSILAAVDKRIGAFVLMAGAYSDEEYVFDSSNAAMVAYRKKLGDEPLRRFFATHRWDDPAYFVERSGPAAVYLQFGSRDEAIPERLARRYHAAFERPKEIAFYDAGHALDAAARRARATWLTRRLGVKVPDTAALDRIPPLR